MNIEDEVLQILESKNISEDWESMWHPKTGQRWIVTKPLVYQANVADYEAEMKDSTGEEREWMQAMLDAWRAKGWIVNNDVVLPAGTIVEIPDDAYKAPNGPICKIGGIAEMPLCDWDCTLKDYLELVYEGCEGYDLAGKHEILEDIDKLNETIKRFEDVNSLEDLQKVFSSIELQATWIMRKAEEEQVKIDDLLEEGN